MLAYIYIPVIQKELDIFRTTVWNHGRGRKQVNKQLPTGVPDLIFTNPENYNGQNYGLELSQDELIDVADATSILDNVYGYLSEELMNEFNEYVDVDQIKPKEAADAFLFLKAQFS